MGVTELNQALSIALPSFNFPRPGLADGTDTIRPATLRGLSPDQTLVLLNSKRRHASSLVNVNGTIGRGAAAVDLNTIPTAAVNSIEVLRDGASAQYGSDAIAGVINVRLRDDARGRRPHRPVRPARVELHDAHRHPAGRRDLVCEVAHRPQRLRRRDLHRARLEGLRARRRRVFSR